MFPLSAKIFTRATAVFGALLGFEFPDGVVLMERLLALITEVGICIYIYCRR